MEVTRNMVCPMPTCGRSMRAWEFGDQPITVVSCKECHLDGVVGDDRLLDNSDLDLITICARLKKRAEKLEEARKQAANRYVDVKR